MGCNMVLINYNIPSFSAFPNFIEKSFLIFFQHYYYTGAHVRITPVIRGGWQCQKCKWCQNCRQANQDDRYLLCDVCDGAFHAHCLRPQMASIPKNGWKCKVSKLESYSKHFQNHIEHVKMNE